MKYMKIILLVPIIGLSLTACTTLRTHVLPNGEDQYSVVATAADGSTAIHAAIKKAQIVCAKQHKQCIVLRSRLLYHGLGKISVGTRIALLAAGDIFPNANSYYESRVVFECVSQ